MRIFQNLRYKTSIRDVYLSPKYSHELRDRLPDIKDPELPQVSSPSPAGLPPLTFLPYCLPPPPFPPSLYLPHNLSIAFLPTLPRFPRRCSSRAATLVALTRCNNLTSGRSWPSYWTVYRVWTQQPNVGVVAGRPSSHAGGVKATSAA